MTPPPIKGGQGRTERELRESAEALAAWLLVAILAIVLLAVLG